mmetsp:Transcript_8555/g.20761  ORF Transcript_8555/g.20761 Transcript_8555/m.20761 type:complete len:421 (-) Transcript_8555:392-1654(-)|eukprot:CAMPEP_0178993994 /NCGR_PEP_ID=MMETSP0795-20121207/7028_1 /TAXON_ID=88552 /ORGANISM="Amoebophrya sp., Strain Ameob2" /LENGTH=420 /DNA_ID=CAMNT_0020686147 /DNA_START=187 /DNA_END=1449 /DNA_ORIENTATION=-
MQQQEAGTPALLLGHQLSASPTAMPDETPEAVFPAAAPHWQSLLDATRMSASVSSSSSSSCPPSPSAARIAEYPTTARTPGSASSTLAFSTTPWGFVFASTACRPQARSRCRTRILTIKILKVHKCKRRKGLVLAAAALSRSFGCARGEDPPAPVPDISGYRKTYYTDLPYLTASWGLTSIPPGSGPEFCGNLCSEREACTAWVFFSKERTCTFRTQSETEMQHAAESSTSATLFVREGVASSASTAAEGSAQHLLQQLSKERKIAATDQTAAALLASLQKGDIGFSGVVVAGSGVSGGSSSSSSSAWLLSSPFSWATSGTTFDGTTPGGGSSLSSHDGTASEAPSDSFFFWVCRSLFNLSQTLIILLGLCVVGIIVSRQCGESLANWWNYKLLPVFGIRKPPAYSPQELAAMWDDDDGL